VVFPLSDESLNLETQQEIARRVAQPLIAPGAPESVLTIGSLAANYFSFTFPVDIQTDQGLTRVFVKVPKADLRNHPMTILPVSDADRRLAQDEIDSLRALETEWDGDDVSVWWVRLRMELPEFNAIVTDRAEGAEALDVFRRFDLRRRLGFRRDGRRLTDAMSRLGTALGRHHHTHARELVVRTADEASKLESYIRSIRESVYGPKIVVPDGMLEATASREFDALRVNILKGLDIRNVLIDDSDHLFLLDPGRMKAAPREADLARFIMTYRILYWGSPLWVAGLRPDPAAEAAFLDAYYTAGSPPTPGLLSFYLLKEQLKHWHTALYSLELLGWRDSFKRFFAKRYINPHYQRAMRDELKGLA
jgi:aminoglycoside phosphotransferase (APT) family kinase protein